MAGRPRTPLFVAALASVLVLGLGLGAAAFAMLDDGTTVVRQVTVEGSEPVVASDLPATAIYDRSATGVVEIAASGGGGVGSQSAQGSGFVYDEDGHIVTNQHVVAGASSISVRFWNGVERDATLMVKALISDTERRDAERELRIVRGEQAITERLRTLQDGRDGKDGEKGLPGENGAVGPPGPPGEAIQGPPGEIPAVPAETAEQIEKALILLAQPVVTFTEASPVVVNIGERPKRKTITMRRDEQGNAVADVIERDAG